MEFTTSRRARIVRGAVCSVIALWLVLPLATIIPISFSDLPSFAFPPKRLSLANYRSLSDPVWIDALRHSLIVAILAALLSTVLGTLAAFGLVRSRSRAVGAVRVLVLAPQVVPIIIVGLGMYLVFLRWRLVGTVHGFVFAHTVLCLPLVVVPVTAAVETFDRTLERASASLGAGPVATFRQITFPILRPAILGASVLAFLGSFDEFVLSFFLQTPTFSTLPVALYRRMTDSIDPAVAAVATIQLTVVIAGVVVALVRQGRRERASRSTS